MTTLVNESSPQIELHHGLKLGAAEVAALTVANSSTDPEEVWHKALLAYNVFAIRRLREELVNQTIINDTVIRRTLDTIWVSFSPVFRKTTGPMIAEAYLRAFREVQEGNVPAQYIFALAEEHAARVGQYYNDTSTEALIQGFNTYVNRQVPQKAALERVIDAYGLTPRQMSGFTSATALNPTKVESSIPQNLKRKIKEYIGRSITARLGVFKRQEAHNLDMQAKQVAWLWLVENHRLPGHAEKMWLTAKDEKVCTVCGPMNGKKVEVGEKFEMPNGAMLFVPGAHVNCRCVVRLQVNPFVEEVQKDAIGAGEIYLFNRQHPRGGNGRFIPKRQGEHPQEREPRVAERERSEVLEDMLRQVREQQEAEAKQPVIEEAPTKPLLDVPEAKPKLDVPTAKPRLDVPAAPAPPVTKPLLEVPPTPAPAQPKPRLDVPIAPVTKPRLEVPETKPRLDVAKPVFDADYAILERLQDERQTAFQAHETQQVTYRPTRRIKDRYGKPATGYLIRGASATLTPTQDKAILTDKDQIQLHGASHLDQVTNEQLKREFDEGLIDAMEDVYSEYQQYEEPEDEGGRAYIILEDVTNDRGSLQKRYAKLDLDDLSSVVEEALWNKKEYGAKYDAMMRGGIHLTWHDSKDFKNAQVIGENDYSALEIADEYLSINPDQYRPVVMKIEDGYSDARMTSQEYNTWAAPGVYTVVNQTYKIANIPTMDPETLTTVDSREVPYMEVTLRPQVNERSFLQLMDTDPRRPDFPPD